jgi:hypothetical protein
MGACHSCKERPSRTRAHRPSTRYMYTYMHGVYAHGGGCACLSSALHRSHHLAVEQEWTTLFVPCPQNQLVFVVAVVVVRWLLVVVCCLLCLRMLVEERKLISFLLPVVFAFSDDCPLTLTFRRPKQTVSEKLLFPLSRIGMQKNRNPSKVVKNKNNLFPLLLLDPKRTPQKSYTGHSLLTKAAAAAAAAAIHSNEHQQHGRRR